MVLAVLLITPICETSNATSPFFMQGRTFFFFYTAELRVVWWVFIFFLKVF